MRLKTYTASTTPEAMELVHSEMGEDAIIVSVQKGQNGQGVRITAAVEHGWSDSPDLNFTPEPEYLDIGETIRQTLTYHGTPPRLTDRFVTTACSLDADDPTMAFAGALDAIYRFSPLDGSHGTGKPIMLIGAPGAGKTISVAKLAARSTLAGESIGLITTDTKRAGGIEQLAAFARILKQGLDTADSPEELSKAVQNHRDKDIIYIDTQGTNPFSDADLDYLSGFISAADAEPLLVMAAGGDAMEAADMASSFSTLGVRRMLLT
ncbi:MAG: GTPase, partial [Rhodospirillales bacterium]|nr:GTPase [Rhodospirillales bacterium]